MNHYDSAEALLAMADERALGAMQASQASGDPMAILPGILGAALNILAAQVHATLAVADATERGEGGTDGN